MNLKELVKQYPLFLRLEKDGSLSMFFDHHSLSHMRNCEVYFQEEILNRTHFRVGSPVWGLQFGLWTHECLALFYNEFKLKGTPPVIDDWVKQCIGLWEAYDLDYFKPDPLKLVKDYRTDEKKYRAFGGKEGATALLIHYYAFYMNQRFRIVATEVAFGRTLEVPLGVFKVALSAWKLLTVKCFLTGRIDLLADNNYKIGPIDHKTTASFDGHESDDYDPHEGITGYIYAVDAILRQRFPENPYKICRDGWVFHISSNANEDPRFKATLITKTPQQLESYRLRQLKTFKRIFGILSGEIADWNTLICNSIYNRPCPYRELHRQAPNQREGTLGQFYEIHPAWDPENPPDTKKKEKKEILEEHEKANV